MLLLAHLIQQHQSWRDSRVRLLRIVDSEDAVRDTRAHMAQLSETARVQVEPVVIVRSDGAQPLSDLIAERSADADLTLLGMRLPDADEVEAYCDRLNDLVQAVGSVLLVRNAELGEDLLTSD